VRVCVCGARMCMCVSESVLERRVDDGGMGDVDCAMDQEDVSRSTTKTPPTPLGRTSPSLCGTAGGILQEPWVVSGTNDACDYELVRNGTCEGLTMHEPTTTPRLEYPKFSVTTTPAIWHDKGLHTYSQLQAAVLYCSPSQ
jgi:hypothetical protein